MQKLMEVRLHSADTSCISERGSSFALSAASASRTERAGVEPASLRSFLSYPERREQTLTAHRWLCLHTETLHKIQLHDCNTSHGLSWGFSFFRHVVSCWIIQPYPDVSPSRFVYSFKQSMCHLYWYCCYGTSQVTDSAKQLVKFGFPLFINWPFSA